MHAHRPLDRLEEQGADQRHAASEDDDLRVERMHQAGQVPADGAPGVFQYGAGQSIPLQCSKPDVVCR